MTKEELVERGNEEEAIDAYIELAGEEFIDYFEEAYQGKWASDEDFVQELIEETEEGIRNIPSYIHIDWERTARDIMMDYSEENGYYFRDL